MNWRRSSKAGHWNDKAKTQKNSEMEPGKRWLPSPAFNPPPCALTVPARLTDHAPLAHPQPRPHHETKNSLHCSRAPAGPRHVHAAFSPAALPPRQRGQAKPSPAGPGPRHGTKPGKRSAKSIPVDAASGSRRFRLKEATPTRKDLKDHDPFCREFRL